MKNVDVEDQVRDLRGKLAHIEAMLGSDSYHYFLHLVDQRIERERVEMEKGGDEIKLNTIVGRIAGLRLIDKILETERSEIRSDIQARGAQV